MLTKVEIRLALYTQTGPAGWRLERAAPLPIKQFDFPDTPDGRQAAEQAREHLADYVTKYHIPKSKNSRK